MPDPETGVRQSHPRLRAETRGGSRLEFGLEQQLQTYIAERFLKEKERRIKRLNEHGRRFTKSQSKKLPPQTMGEWIEAQSEVFKHLPETERLGLLFNSQSGPRKLSCMLVGD